MGRWARACARLLRRGRERLSLRLPGPPRLTVLTSWLFWGSACACRNAGWMRPLLLVMSPLSAATHASLGRGGAPWRLLRAVDKALAHGIGAAQLVRFCSAPPRASWGSALYVTSLVSAACLYHVGYPRRGEDWVPRHACLHLVCAGGCVAFDAAVARPVRPPGP